MSDKSEKKTYKILHDKYSSYVIVTCDKIKALDKNHIKIHLIDSDNNNTNVHSLITKKTAYFNSVFKSKTISLSCLKDNSLCLKHENKITKFYDIVNLLNVSNVKLKLKILFYATSNEEMTYISCKLLDLQIISEFKVHQINEKSKYKPVYAKKSKFIINKVLSVLDFKGSDSLPFPLKSNAS